MTRHRQQEIFRVIEHYIAEHGCSPSNREIAIAAGLKSPSTVVHHLRQMKADGLVTYQEGVPRTVRVIHPGQERASTASISRVPVPRSAAAEMEELLDTRDLNEVVWVPLVGQIAAGTPIPPLESISDRYPLPREIVGVEEGLFLLRVEGDSMTGVGIFPGDWVVVRQLYDQPKNGDIVAAVLTGFEAEGTVKTYMKADRQVWLMPQNSAHIPIPGTKAAIHGKVVAVLRQV